jgi:G-patch domain
MTGLSFSIRGATRKRPREPLENVNVESKTPSCSQSTAFVDYDDGLSDASSSATNDGPRVRVVNVIFDKNSSVEPRQVKKSKAEVDGTLVSSHPAEARTQSDNQKASRRRISGSQIARLLERRRIEREEFQMDEDVAFNFDLHQCADSSRAEDYERLPVESFGSSLLTAMGWDGKPDVNAKHAAAVKPRQPLLGLGAHPRRNGDKESQGRKKSEKDTPNVTTPPS